MECLRNVDDGGSRRCEELAFLALSSVGTRGEPDLKSPSNEPCGGELAGMSDRSSSSSWRRLRANTDTLTLESRRSAWALRPRNCCTIVKLKVSDLDF